MALRVNKSNKPTEYILLADRASSQPTKFLLRPLSWEEDTEAEDLAPAQTMTLEQAQAVGEVMQKVRADGRSPAELTPEEIARINEIAPSDARRVNALTKQHAVRCRYGIVEIRGLLDQDDQPMKMSGAEFARTAPKEVIFELGTEILRISKLAEAEIKN